MQPAFSFHVKELQRVKLIEYICNCMKNVKDVKIYKL